MDWDMSPNEKYRYDAYMQVANMNVGYMQSIGFTIDEINALKNSICVDRTLTVPYLCSMGYSQQTAARLMYLYKICVGKVSIETKEDLSKHLRRMFGETYKISIRDLSVSNISKVPRVAVIAGITKEPFTIYNSSLYKDKGAQMLYGVTSVAGKSITIKTKRKPQLPRKQALKIPDVLEIKGVDSKGFVEMTVNKRFIRLCNRFIIAASFRQPEFHHGMYEIICFEGTKIYVFAQTMGVRENVKYSSTSQRIYDYGFFENQIPVKLKQATQILYSSLHGAHSEYFEGNQKFLLLDEVRKDRDLDDENMPEILD